MTALKAAFNFASPGGDNGKLTTFIFHRVLPQPDPLFPHEPDAARFDQMLGWIKAWFNVLPLDVAIERLRTRQLPPRAAAISFDDGYADNRTVALPILQQHGLPACFFIATGFLDGGRMWNDTVIESVRACSSDSLNLTELGLGSHPINSVLGKRTAIEAIIGQIKYLPVGERLELTQKLSEAAGVTPPSDLMLTSAQVKELHAGGMQIGAHTVSHPILARTDLPEARREITSSKLFLEQLLQTRIGLFAYPNGKPGNDYLPEHATLVRELGFDAAVSTAWGVADHRTDPFQIPRFTPWDKSRLRFAIRLLRNF
jgi:peptidoglycan/xylan/chitin deacetylase (PgdA/CDA1 family)